MLLSCVMGVGVWGEGPECTLWPVFTGEAALRPHGGGIVNIKVITKGKNRSKAFLTSKPLARSTLEVLQMRKALPKRAKGRPQGFLGTKG